MQLSINDFQFMCVCTFRYCLGRSSYVTEWCVHVITEHIDWLDGNTKLLIIREIKEALDEDKAGMEMDKDEWKKLLHILKGQNNGQV